MSKLKHEITTIDRTTGEIVQVSKSFTVKTTTDKFYMVFIEQMNPLFKIETATDRKVLDIMCRNAEFNTGKISITPAKRVEFCNELQITSQSFANSLFKLKGKGLITGRSGDYEINPNIFWKGTTDERNRLLRQEGAEITIKFKAE